MSVNLDEVFEAMAKDEAEDAKLITPVNYGRLRGIAPQLIYYYIRSGKIPWKYCDCGRKVIEKEEADEYLRSIGKLKPNG
jgi:predicted site-specific integrase-resolvase